MWVNLFEINKENVKNGHPNRPEYCKVEMANRRPAGGCTTRHQLVQIMVLADNGYTLQRLYDLSFKIILGY